MFGKMRVKCPKCGNVVDITDYIPCSKCGAQLGPVGGAIQVYRMGNPIGIAAGFGIYIDGQPYGHLGNAESVCISVPFGTHTIHMTQGMNRKCTDLTVTLTPQAPIAYMKAHIRMGFWSNTIVIEPSTPDQMPR